MDDYGDTGLADLSRGELLARLRACPPGMPERRRLEAECRRRAARWDRVAGWALVGLLGGLLLLQLALWGAGG